MRRQQVWGKGHPCKHRCIDKHTHPFANTRQLARRQAQALSSGAEHASAQSPLQATHQNPTERLVLHVGEVLGKFRRVQVIEQERSLPLLEVTLSPLAQVFSPLERRPSTRGEDARLETGGDFSHFQIQERMSSFFPLPALPKLWGGCLTG